MSSDPNNVYLAIQARFAIPVTIVRQRQQTLGIALTADGAWTASVYAVDTEPDIANSGRTMLDITSSHSVPVQWVNLLHGIEEEHWPTGFVEGRPNDFLFDHYPTGLQQLCDETVQRSKRQAHRLFGLIRWRLRADTWQGTQAWEGQSYYWSSTESHDWHRLRLLWNIQAGPASVGFPLGVASQEILQSLAITSIEEPLGREIWHAASSASDARTSIILAVSAVEVEAKRVIAELVPDSEWLVMNLPSPPLPKLIKEYLPTLPGVDPSLSIPKHLRTVLQTAVELRNEFVHVGSRSGDRWSGGETSPEQTQEILEATSDLLWLFDCYRGEAWALQYLSRQTKDALGLRDVQ